MALHVVKIACELPDEQGRSLSHWDSVEIARKLVEDGIVDSISHSERARVAYAVLAGDNLTFEFDQAVQGFPGVRQACTIRNEELLAS